MHTQFPSAGPGSYAPGYFPQGTVPHPPLSPSSHSRYHSGYPQLPQQVLTVGGGGYAGGTGQLRGSSPPFVPQNRRSSPPFVLPLNPSPPRHPYNPGAPHVPTFQPQFEPQAYSMPGEYHYAPATQPLQGHRLNPLGAKLYGPQPSHVPVAHAYPGNPALVPTQSFHHGSVPNPPGAPPVSSPNAATRFYGPYPGHAPAQYFHPTPANLAPAVPFVHPSSSNPAARPTSSSNRGRTSPRHGVQSPLPGLQPVPIHAESISSSRGPQANVALGRIPPPHDGILFDTFGDQMSREEQLMLWDSLSPLDQLRLVSEYRQKSQQPVSAQVSSASVPGRQTKGKAKAMHTTASAEGSFPPTGAPASGTYKSPYVEDTFDMDGSFAGTQTYEHSGLASFRPAAHSQYRAAGRVPAPSHDPPMVPQGNHFSVVMLDAIDGVTCKLDNIGTLFGGFIQTYPVNHVHCDGGCRPAAGLRHPTQAGRQETNAHAHVDDGYTADEEEEEEEEREEKRLKAELEAQKARDRPYHLQLVRSVRRHVMYMLLKVKSTKELPPRYPPHFPDQIAAYNRGECPPIGKDNFRPDFVSGWKTGNYNCDAHRFCIEDFIRELKGGLYSDPPLPSRFTRYNVVVKAIDNHMDYLRREYKVHAAAKTPQNVEWLERRQERKRVNARKSTTYKVRVRTIDRHSLVQHRELFDLLKPCHMSADEAEVEDELDDRQKHPRIYIIVDAAWQSQEFKTFIRILELWNIADWRQSIKGRLPSGNAPRTRVEKGVTRVVDSKAPEGLWRNCYSQTWLDSLPGHVRARLNILDCDYDFSLPTYQKPAYIDPKEFPVPEEEDEAAEEDDDDDGVDGAAVGVAS